MAPNTPKPIAKLLDLINCLRLVSRQSSFRRSAHSLTDATHKQKHPGRST